MNKALRNLLFIVGFLLICATPFISPAVVNLFTPGGRTNTLNGEWFGVVDVRSLSQPLPPLEENEGNAVMHVTFRPTVLTHMNTFTGKAEVKDDQGITRTFNVRDLSILQSGRISGFMEGDDMQGTVDGSFEPGKLALTSGTRTSALRMQGVLRQGTTDDYNRLCTRMIALGKDRGDRAKRSSQTVM